MFNTIILDKYFKFSNIHFLNTLFLNVKFIIDPLIDLPNIEYHQQTEYFE